MLALPAAKDRTFRVIGQGPSGRAAADALAASGATVTVWDDDAARREAATHIAKGPRASLDGVDGVVLCDGGVGTCGKQMVTKAKSAGVRVLTDIDLFHEAIEAIPAKDRPRLVAVSGGAGKSVTAALIVHIAEAAGRTVTSVGDPSRPFLAMKRPARGDLVVCELPMPRLSITRRLSCDASVLVGLGVGMERNRNVALGAILRLVRNQKRTGLCVVAVDDPFGQQVCMALQAGAHQADAGEIVPVSGSEAIGHGVFLIGGAAYSIRDGRTNILGEFSRAAAVQSAPMRENAAAAIALALSLDVSPAQIMKSLHDFQGLPGRLQTVAEEGRVLIIDDSYARSPRAVELAIRSSGDVFWIGGTPPARRPKRMHGVYELARCDDQDAMTEALDRATTDATRFAAEHEGSAPVVLFSPGVATDPAVFRRVVAAHLDEGAEAPGDSHV